MPDFIINEEEVLNLAGDTSGPVAQEIQRVAERIAQKAKDNLSNLYPPSGVVGSYPAKRTGKLQGSIHLLPVELGHDGIFVDVVADAVGDHGWVYGNILRERGYIFLTETDLESLVEK